MKKVISLSAVIMMFSIAAIAQDSTTNATTPGKDSSMRNADSLMTQTPVPANKDTAVSTTTNTTTNKMDSAANAATTKTNAAATTVDSTAKTVTTTVTDTASATKVIATDRVIMKDDKMYLVKSGDSSLLEKSYKLESGAVVSTTGNVKYPSGRIVQLKNGQFIELVKPSSSATETKKTTTTETKKPATKKKTGN